MARQPSRLADFLPYQLSIASNSVSDLIAREYHSRFGLKVPEWRVMAVLGDVGSATQRELVAATRMDKVAVNRAVKGLFERKLLKRSPHASDGRSHHLELTASGGALHDEIMPLAQHMETLVLEGFSDAERAQMSDWLIRLRDRVDKLSG